MTKVFSRCINRAMDSQILTTAEAATRLGVSVRRVQQMVKSGQLPADTFGGSLMIQAGDLALVADRKPGRPPLTSEEKAVRAEKRATAGQASSLPPAVTAKPKTRAKKAAKAQAAKKGSAK